MSMVRLAVNTQQPYVISIDHHLLQPEVWSSTVSLPPGRCVFITDDQVAPLYARALADQHDAPLLVMPAGESYKTREQKQRLEDQMLQLGLLRDTCLIAIGGGVVTDMAGYLASTYCRGIPVVYCPTSLLAMVDASVGGKTGVNTTYGKNLIGTFKQPHSVIIDPDVLRTLPLSEWVNGAAEVIKHALLSSQSSLDRIQAILPQLLSRQMIGMAPVLAESIAVKQQVVQQDEREHGLRACLNLGHTVAHGIEIASDYRVPHGAAVLQGLMIESVMAMQMGVLPQSELSMVLAVCCPLLPHCSLLSLSDIDDVMNAMAMDKKNQGDRIHCVLLSAVGEVHQQQGQFTVPVTQKALRDAMTHVVQREFLAETIPC